MTFPAVTRQNKTTDSRIGVGIRCTGCCAV